jgi:hypothetical protein
MWHFTEPCRSMAGDSNSTLYSEDFVFNGQSAMNCTGPDAGATLQVIGNLTASSVPTENFQCDCVCDVTRQYPTNLGTVAVLLRATDVATASSPNYKDLVSECLQPSLQPDGQVFTTVCNSPRIPGIQVRI